MKKYTIEFFGTFFLLLISALSQNPIAIGLGLAALIYTGAHISGAHYNPAVSLAMLIRGEITKKDCLLYVLFQILGAVFGSLVYFLITNDYFDAIPEKENFSRCINSKYENDGLNNPEICRIRGKRISSSLYK